MFAFFRRWLERRARTCIALALSEQFEYEAGHRARQTERLPHIQHARHGEYDADQRAASVELKVRAAYAGARRRPPKRLRQLVLEALEG